MTRESAKWRSGREDVRNVSIRFSVRRGEKPSALGKNKSITREDHRYVMMPSRVPSAFEVIKAELPLESLICVLGSPLLFRQANQLLLGKEPWRDDKIELVRLWFVISPFHQKPDDFALGTSNPFVGDGQNKSRRKASRKFAIGSLTPGRSTETVVVAFTATT